MWQSIQLNTLQSPGIKHIFDLAKHLEQTRKIYHLEIGQPYFSLPDFIKSAIYETAREDVFSYVPSRGDYHTCQVLCQWLNDRFPQQFSPDQNITFTTGVSEALVAVYAVLLKAGDKILVPTPAWPHYQQVAKLFNAEVIEVPLPAEQNFLLDIALLEKYWDPHCKLLIFNNPNNPTGACYSLDFQRELFAWAKRRNIIVIIDEIYDCYNYNNKFSSALNFPDLLDHTIYLNGFSKSLNLTGLRIGYIIATKELTDAINNVHYYLTLSPSSFGLRVVAKSISSIDLTTFLQQNLLEHKKRFDIVKQAFIDIPKLKLNAASGAFYFYITYPPSFGEANSLCEKLLYETGVALAPGYTFGDDFQHHLRLCYSTNLSDLEYALKQIKVFFGNYTSRS